MWIMSNMTERKEKDIIKQTLQQLNPTEEQKQKMWKYIQTQANQKNRNRDGESWNEKNWNEENWNETNQSVKNQDMKENEQKQGRKVPAVWKKTVAAAVIAAAVITTGVGGNAATGGKMLRTIQEWCGISRTEQEIAHQAKNIAKNQTEVYAPEIYDVNANRVVFGTSRGLIIYDISKEVITGTIDVQAIDCIYFNSDQKKTHVFVNGDQLVVFNTENGKPMGKYYQFDLSQIEKQENETTETTLLEAAASGDDQEQFAAYQKQVQKKEKNSYVDTFKSMPDAYFLDKNAQKEHNIMYSENSYCWKDQDGKEYTSCLVAMSDSNKYTLYTEQKDTKTIQKLALNLEISSLPMLASKEGSETKAKQDSGETAVSNSADGVMDDTMLPQFIYSGKDNVMKAICDYMTELAAEEYGVDDNTKVWIPGITEYGRKKVGNHIYVYGKFMNYGYKRNGKILETVDGDTAAVRFVLKKGSDGYQVTEMNQPKDGQEYAKNLKELTADAPEIYEKYFTDQKEQEEKQRKELIRMYVSDNELPITYYKDYGWDPVVINEK